MVSFRKLNHRRWIKESAWMVNRGHHLCSIACSIGADSASIRLLDQRRVPAVYLSLAFQAILAIWACFRISNLRVINRGV
jgi:hypothetical protein